MAPSAVPFVESDPPPQALDKKGIEAFISAFIASTKRAIKAGFKIIEIHSAHGYLLHSFLSPISNRRTDEYGGSLENRMRLHKELVTELRRTIPADMPLFMRISASDWVDGGWDVEQSVTLAKLVKPLGVDLIDASSGGMVPKAVIPVGRNYQVPFATQIRKEAEIMTGAVGLITEPDQANDIITSSSADLVFIARQMLREPYFAIRAEEALNQDPAWPLQYGYAVRRHRR